MYRTCIFCNAPLGANDVVEAFPVGRRLAFDAAKGRLWAVCARCERWNLTPLEERWEAIEQCERLFHDTRRRVSTDNIGLARLAEGLELVRIGRPARPELAAWRYGDQFGRRRRRTLLRSGAGLVVGAGLIAGAPLLGAVASGMIVAASLVSNVAMLAAAKRGEIVLPHPEQGRMHLTMTQLHEVRLVQRPGQSGWGLVVPYAKHQLDSDTLWQRAMKKTNLTMGAVTLEGPEAQRVAGRLLPRINRGGGAARHVRVAVTLIEEAGAPERFFAAAAGRTREWGALQNFGDTGAIRFLPQPVRLALEMATHEESERTALEQGELARLADAWREAEEVAAIADDLLLPAAIAEKLRQLRRRARAGGGDTPPGV